ncbi:MAG: D-sedoheptulose-7-phosphate isomerase [Candidatus Puniceispirillales bacterium]
MMSNAIRTHMEISAQVKLAVADACSDSAEKAAYAIAKSLKQNGKLMLCGNGGSAGDAQHLAAEFVATLNHRNPRPGLAALALTTDTSFITAYANDFGFDGIFERQIQALGHSGDVLIGISTSGHSANVVKAMSYARANHITTIAMTGEGGGTLADLADILIAVPSTDTMHIQESHIALGHAITAMVETLMTADQSG